MQDKQAGEVEEAAASTEQAVQDQVQDANVAQQDSDANVDEAAASTETAQADTAPDAAAGGGDGESGAGVDAPPVEEVKSEPNSGLDAPAAAAGTQTDMTTKPDFVHGVHGAVVLVIKGHEKIPVQVKDKAHYDRLVAEHGADHVQIQGAA